MRRPRPISYNPVQVLKLISEDRQGRKVTCPACSGPIARDPAQAPVVQTNAQYHVTLHCKDCGRVAMYLAGPFSVAGAA